MGAVKAPTKLGRAFIADLRDKYDQYILKYYTDNLLMLVAINAVFLTLYLENGLYE